MRISSLLCLSCLLALGCEDDTNATVIIPRGGPDGGPGFDAFPRTIRDASTSDAARRDATIPDMHLAEDGAVSSDAAPIEDMALIVDMAPVADMASARDMAFVADMASPVDMAPVIDMAPAIDMAPIIDMAPPPEPEPQPDPLVPPGRRACSQGEGWTLFEVHWDGTSSARIDHWDAACEYSIRINDACGAFDRCGDAIANCRVEVVDRGMGLLLDGRDDLLFRFSVAGIAFQGATLYFSARATRGAADLEVTSPLWGGLVGPIPFEQQYQVFEVDWSEFLRPGDQPNLTGINFEASRNNVAIHAVELCLR